MIKYYLERFNFYKEHIVLDYASLIYSIKKYWSNLKTKSRRSFDDKKIHITSTQKNYFYHQKTYVINI